MVPLSSVKQYNIPSAMVTVPFSSAFEDHTSSPVSHSGDTLAVAGDVLAHPFLLQQHERGELRFVGEALASPEKFAGERVERDDRALLAAGRRQDPHPVHQRRLAIAPSGNIATKICE